MQQCMPQAVQALQHAIDQDLNGHWLAPYCQKITGKFESENKEAKLLAEIKFRENNLRSLNYAFSAAEDPIVTMICDDIRLRLYRALPEPDDLYELFEHSYFGPGAACNSKGSGFVARLVGGLTFYGEESISLFNAVQKRSPVLSNAITAMINNGQSITSVNACKLEIVPKTFKIGRAITIEPSVNQFLFLGIGRWLRKKLFQFGINLSYQQVINKKLAELGSVNRNLATIDLASASDSLSLNVCERLLPGWLYSLMSSIRSEYIDIQGEVVKIGMMGGMGNGFIFPLQTLIFHLVSQVSCDYLGLEPQSCSTFGDDIIVPTEAAILVMKVLNHLGFTVNSDKSHYSPFDPFRESCGADFLDGSPCRPVFIKRLEHESDFYVAYNNIVDFCAKHNITMLRTLDLLVKSMPVRKVCRLFDPPDSGLRLPRGLIPKRYTMLQWKPSKAKALDDDRFYAAFLRGDVRDGRYSIRYRGKYRQRDRENYQLADPVLDYDVSRGSIYYTMVSVSLYGVKYDIRTPKRHRKGRRRQ